MRGLSPRENAMKDKIRVAVIGPSSLEKGGVSTVINNILEDIYIEDVLFFEYASWKSGNILFRISYSIYKLMFFPFFLIKNDIDVAYLHFSQNGSFTRKKYYSKVAKFLNKKVIFHSHSSSFNIFYNQFQEHKKEKIKKVFKDYCDCLIVLGEEWKQFYEEEVGIPLHKIEVLYNAVRCPSYNLYNSSSYIITMFGRLGSRKGTYDVLKVAKMFQDNKYKVHFKLYGDGDLKEVQEIITTQQVSNVSVEKWIKGDEKTQAMSQGVLNILPSYNEGMPMAILETMALGVPNISTNVGDIKEVISEGNNGFIIEPGEIQNLYKTIENYIYKTDNEYKKQMSTVAQQTINTKFNIDNYGKKLRRVFMKYY